ncbi:F-box protein At3g07870-like [Pistacia vera]|uniref:F-box protein At3g07870-like n=1 Tax=Pistacia vera TaxID=55513 RepID=UPI001262DDCA|nr:F-box protein At3g07870-like [Pistacia vera]
MDSVCEKQSKSRKLGKDGDAPKITLECLPREISFNILSSLSITSLAKIKFVCRAWCNLAKDPLLINMHFLRMTENDPCFILHQDYPVQDQNYFVDFSARNESYKALKKFCVPLMPKFDIVGSCNGLLCLRYSSSPASHSLCIYNPFTGDYLKLPEPTKVSHKEMVNVFGFGFHPTTKEYKVIAICFESANSLLYRDLYTDKELEAQIFWPHKYWLGLLVVSFDLADDQFREVPKPDCPTLGHHNHLAVLGGCLSAAFLNKVGMHPSKSSKLYLKKRFFRVICLLKNGEILLEYMHRALYSYDPKNRTFKDLDFPGVPNWFETIVHVGSLNWIDIPIDM